jgi:hypothetical protein
MKTVRESLRRLMSGLKMINLEKARGSIEVLRGSRWR